MAGPKCFGCATGGGGSDTTPDAFSFTDQTGVATSTTITSAAVSITGIDTAITCSATGGTVDKNSSGSFASSQSVANNDTIRARHTSSASNSTTTNTAVDCNGVSDTFSSTTVAGGGAFVYPIGIPTVPAGLEPDIDLPTLPSPWTSNQAGYYYVKQGGANGGNGYPGSPRGSLPASPAAGSIIVLDNTATLSVSTVTLDFASATSGSRIWLIGSGQVGLGSGTTKAQINYTSDSGVSGDNFYIDGVRFHANNANQIGFSFGPNIQSSLIRHSEFSGTGVQRSANAGNAIQGSSPSSLTQYNVLYDVSFHDMGAWDPVSLGSDIDVHCLQVNGNVQDLWILYSSFYHCQGDGIQFTASGDNTPLNQFAQRVYIGKSAAYENLQAGFWLKHGDKIIFSQNTVYNQNLRAGIGAGTGDPICMGGQYDFAEVWYLFNRLYDCDNAFRFASYSNTQRSNINLVGNVITNTKWAGSVNVNSANTDGTAIAFWQGGTVKVIGNTIWKFTGQGISSTPGAASAMILENNIIYGRTNGSAHDLFLEGGGGWTQPRARNNDFAASPRLHSNGTTWTSVSAFQSADSSNRQNNLSVDPLFVNAINGGSGDFNTQSGSPMRNAGTINTDIYATFNSAYGLDIRKDFLGTTRPVGAAYDIGAFEN